MSVPNRMDKPVARAALARAEFDGPWVLLRLGEDSILDRTFLAPDGSWVVRFADARQGTLDEIEAEISTRITHVFYDDNGFSYHPCPAAEVLLRRGVDDQE